MSEEKQPAERRWRDNDLDNELLKELASKSPSEERIRDLVRQGANVNSVWICGSVLTDAILMMHRGLDPKFVRLLIELGADVNWHDEDGSCALLAACHNQKPDFVEYLLQKGADPNVILDYNKSLLDYAESDQCYHETEASGLPPSCDDAIAAKAMGEIVTILQHHGAKPIEDIEAQNLDAWLKVFACERTGLVTAKGNLPVDRIPGSTTELCQQFRDWLAGYWDSWPDKDWSTMPKGFDRDAHNAQGRELAKRIKSLVGNDVKVMYYSVCAESERKHIRNVNHETIG